MNKKMFACLLTLLFILSGTTYAENYQIVDIREDCTGAVISQIDTKERSSVAVGDYIGEWEIIEIEPDAITIKKDPGEDEPYTVVRRMEKMTKFELFFGR
jgi:hypothetical protein